MSCPAALRSLRRHFFRSRVARHATPCTELKESNAQLPASRNLSTIVSFRHVYMPMNNMASASVIGVSPGLIRRLRLYRAGVDAAEPQVGSMTEFPDARNAQGDNPGTIAPILLSQLGEGIKECELLSWHVAVGDKVEAFHPLCDVQSDKATVEITSRFTGCVTALRHQPGDMIQVGEVLANIQLAEGSSGNAAASVTRVQAPSSSEPPTKKHNPGQVGSPRHVVLASPVVRRMAKDNNLDLAVIRGTGPDGRIVKADVLALAEGSTLVESPARPSAPQAEQPATSSATFEDSGPSGCPQLPGDGDPECIPIRGYARVMVKTMTEASKVPHFYFCDDVCMDNLIKLRARLQTRDGSSHRRLTFLPFLLKAASLALTDFPALNSQLSADANNLLRFPSHNIGVAVATPAGLVVPNIKGVQQKSIQRISDELLELQELAAAGKLSKHHLTGGTITVSNIGSIGGTYAMPLVNVPEAAIVALGRARSVLHLNPEGGVDSRTMMSISWGADHRVVDGATLAAFSNAWKGFIEDPERMLIRLH